MIGYKMNKQKAKSYAIKKIWGFATMMSVATENGLSEQIAEDLECGEIKSRDDALEIQKALVHEAELLRRKWNRINK